MKKASSIIQLFGKAVRIVPDKKEDNCKGCPLWNECEKIDSFENTEVPCYGSGGHFELAKKVYAGGVFVGQMMGFLILFKVTERDGDEIKFDYAAINGKMFGQYKFRLLPEVEDAAKEVDEFFWDWLAEIKAEHTDEEDVDAWVASETQKLADAMGKYMLTHYPELKQYL